MAINTRENLLFSKKHSKQMLSQKSTKVKANDIQSFGGTSIYETGEKSKIDSAKLKSSFLSNISFAGTSNAVSFGSGGYSGYSSNTSSSVQGSQQSQTTQKAQPTVAPQRVQDSQPIGRAETVNSDFDIDGLYSSDKVKKLTNAKRDLIKQYKDLQATIKELDAKKKVAVEMIATIRSKVHQINIDILTAEEEELFG